MERSRVRVYVFELSMDRLVMADVKEVHLLLRAGHKSSATFRLTNLMHTMSVAVSLTVTGPTPFLFDQQFSILTPLSCSSHTLLLSQPSDLPPLPSPSSVLVRSSILPTGKADLPRLFAMPGKHVFRDATIPIFLVGPLAADHLISRKSQIPNFEALLDKAIGGCAVSKLTALLRSTVLAGDAALASNLIDAGGDVNARDVDGRSLVSLAVTSGDVEIVRVLIDSGGAIDDSVLHDAAAMNRVDLMRGRCDVNSVDSGGRTPIHVAAVRGHVEAIRFCLAAGGNCEIADENGWTPLHYATAEGHRRAVECLLDSSPHSKHALNADGVTAYAVAKENAHAGLLPLLRLDDALHRAARVGDAGEVERCLAEGAELNGRDQNGWTPLHRAAFKGRVDCVRLLLSHGAEVDALDGDGHAPLHLAAEARHAQVALELMAHGAQSLKAKGLSVVPPFDIVRLARYVRTT